MRLGNFTEEDLFSYKQNYKQGGPITLFFIISRGISYLLHRVGSLLLVLFRDGTIGVEIEHLNFYVTCERFNSRI